MKYLVDKGSVAVDGISLTVNSLTRAGFTVNIIGHTENADDARIKRGGRRGKYRDRYHRQIYRAAADSDGIHRAGTGLPCQNSPRKDTCRRLSMPASPIPEILEDIKQGKIVILADDESRENEGDLFMAAEKVTPEAINFMAKYGRGLICLSLTEEKAMSLSLPLMVRDNTSKFGTAFTVSIEARHGVTTGISAHDRATTVLAAVRDDAVPDDLVASRPRLPADRAARRCAGQDRPDRGFGGSGAPGGPPAVRRDLRNHERRRDDGPDAGARGVLRTA